MHHLSSQNQVNTIHGQNHIKCRNQHVSQVNHMRCMAEVEVQLRI
jgi:hypothetical protein